MAAGALACPPLAPGGACPLRPVVAVAAFASRTFRGDPPDATQYFGAPSVAAEHTRFPLADGVADPAWFNLQAYSYHSYGATRGVLN